jgi:hypothetical protein
VAAEYLNRLASDAALLTYSFAITHPGQPNYLALFSGSIYADDSCLRPEMVSPHPQRASIENADLDHSQRLMPKAGEVTVVDVEVMAQPVDHPAVRVVFQVFAERVATLIVLLFARDRTNATQHLTYKFLQYAHRRALCLVFGFRTNQTSTIQPNLPWQGECRLNPGWTGSSNCPISI